MSTNSLADLNLTSVSLTMAVKNSLIRGLFLIPLFVTLLGLFIDQSLMSFIQKQMSSLKPASTVWFFAAASAVWSFLWPLFVLAINLSLIGKLPLQGLFERLSFVIKENIRSTGKVLLWSLLFVLPGVYRFTQFFFVTPVCLFNKNYQLGLADALSHSKSIGQGQLSKVFLILFLFFVVVPVGLLGFDSKTVFEENNMTWALIFGVLEYLIQFLFAFVLINFYLKLEGKYESHLQSLRN
jgi:hypothetical protein